MKKLLFLILQVAFYFFNCINEIYQLFYSFYRRQSFKTKNNTFWVGTDLNILGGNFISVGNATKIGKHCVIHAYNKWNNSFFTPSISIGNKSIIGEYNHISAINSIFIGDGFLSGRRVTISDNNHGIINKNNLSIPPINRDLFSNGPIIIGKNVWVGENVCILGNVKIGDGAIIGAGAIVTSDIPPFSVAVGVPAKVIKTIDL